LTVKPAKKPEPFSRRQENGQEITDQPASGARAETDRVALDGNPAPVRAEDAPTQEPGFSWESRLGRREIVGPAQGLPAGWWEIKTEGESGSQRIHADDLPGEIEHDVKDAEDWRRIRKAEEAARAREELQRKSYEDTHGFTDSLGGMQKGKVLKALNALVNYKGRPISRKALVEKKLSEGWRVTDEGDAIESPDGEFWIPAKKLTKTALDYARYLAAKSEPATGKESLQVEPDAAPSQEGAGVSSKMPHGWVWLKGRQLPFTTWREIGRGKNAGKIAVNIRGVERVVDAEDVAQWPGGEKVAGQARAGN